jgi:hypothetical protein
VVATRFSRSVNGEGFTLVSSQGDKLVGNLPIKTGEVVGVRIRSVLVFIGGESFGETGPTPVKHLGSHVI